MNIVLWILQGLLAAHTLMGAIWKLSNSEKTIPSLKAIPHGIWSSLSIIELLSAVGLVLPVLNKNLGFVTPIAALIIATEMLLFCVLHLSSKEGSNNEMIYWLVVAVICGFIAYGRFVLKPF